MSSRWYFTLHFKVTNFVLKIVQILVKLGPKLANNWLKIGRFFSQFLAAHFSREMSRKTISRSREKCEKCAGLVVTVQWF